MRDCKLLKEKVISVRYEEAGDLIVLFFFFIRNCQLQWNMVSKILNVVGKKLQMKNVEEIVLFGILVVEYPCHENL